MVDPGEDGEGLPGALRGGIGQRIAHRTGAREGHQGRREDLGEQSASGRSGLDLAEARQHLLEHIPRRRGEVPARRALAGVVPAAPRCRIHALIVGVFEMVHHPQERICGKLLKMWTGVWRKAHCGGTVVSARDALQRVGSRRWVLCSTNCRRPEFTPRSTHGQPWCSLRSIPGSSGQGGGRGCRLTTMPVRQGCASCRHRMVRAA